MKRKIGIIGFGAVGVTYAHTLLLQEAVDEIIAIDINQERLAANVEDLNDAVTHTSMRVVAGDYKDLTDCQIVCITASVPAAKVTNRLDILDGNVKLLTPITEHIMASGFDGVILIASNPVDVITSIVQKASGLNPNRVIGSGTLLDSLRLRNEIGRAVNVNGEHVSACVIGEHGDSSVPLFSRATIDGKSIEEYCSIHDIEFNYEQVADNMRTAGYKIYDAKGSTNYGIAMSLSIITKAILTDQNVMIAVSSYATGQYGIKDVYIPLPAIVNRRGVSHITMLDISDDELAALKASSELLTGWQRDAMNLMEQYK